MAWIARAACVGSSSNPWAHVVGIGEFGGKGEIGDDSDGHEIGDFGEDGVLVGFGLIGFGLVGFDLFGFDLVGLVDFDFAGSSWSTEAGVCRHNETWVGYIQDTEETVVGPVVMKDDSKAKETTL